VAARRVVSVEAKWVLMDDEQLAKVVAGKGVGAKEIAPDAMKKAGVGVPWRARITCHDRQTVHLSSGRVQTVTIGVEPVVSDYAFTTRPLVKMVHWGAALEVTPVLAADGNSVTVDVKSVVTEPKAMGKIPLHEPTGVKQAGTNVLKSLDRLDFLIHTSRTTARIPLNKPVIVAGMTVGKRRDKKVLYLVLEVAISK